MFEFVDDMGYMRSHQSLCRSMSVNQARAYMAEIEEYRKDYRHTMRRIKTRGWAEERMIGGRMMTVLSKSGEIEAIKILLRNMINELPKDEYWMVAFDFPEVAHAARDEFRRYLKRAGFNSHQQSIWCTQKDAGKKLQRLISILKIDRWVRIYNAKEFHLN